MGIVQMVRRTYADKLDGLTASAQLVDMLVKSLKLGKELRLRKITVENADGVIRIEGDLQFAADSLDRLHVSGRDVTRSPHQCK